MTNHRPVKPIDQYPDATELPPLPPIGLADEPEVPVAGPAVRPTDRAEVAQLRFLDPTALVGRVTLQFPFELDGEEVREIVVRRLSVAQFGAVMERYDDDEPINLFDFLSEMTGRPAPVLRGLIDVDGQEVVTIARPLLPPFVRTILYGAETTNGQANSVTGAGSLSQAPEGSG